MGLLTKAAVNILDVTQVKADVISVEVIALDNLIFANIVDVMLLAKAVVNIKDVVLQEANIKDEIANVANIVLSKIEIVGKNCISLKEDVYMVDMKYVCGEEREMPTGWSQAYSRQDRESKPGSQDSQLQSAIFDPGLSIRTPGGGA